MLFQTRVELRQKEMQHANEKRELENEFSRYRIQRGLDDQVKFDEYQMALAQLASAQSLIEKMQGRGIFLEGAYKEAIEKIEELQEANLEANGTIDGLKEKIGFLRAQVVRWEDRCNQNETLSRELEALKASNNKLKTTTEALKASNDELKTTTEALTASNNGLKTTTQRLKGYLDGIARVMICPISLGVPEEPLVISDGTMYETVAIKTWIRDHDRSPLTNLPITPAFELKVPVLKNVSEILITYLGP